jgi:hypothetical protein
VVVEADASIANMEMLQMIVSKKANMVFPK